jgi:hypothetical protein
MEKECRDCKARKKGNCYPPEEWIDCCKLGNHKYSEIECPRCGHIFCWECAEDGVTRLNEVFWVVCPRCGTES